ncbi:MAG: hypothetical protein EXX96DRAFT_20987 [Benjaminiella poitrasii]|nr:MAG: hypothetical protein EXX96DRAFT_20987 [Benjaminiella poitrasii]
MPVSTLYTICFDYIKNHTNELTSLEGIPFIPVIENLLDFFFQSDTSLNSAFLSLISQSHAKELRTAHLDWTYISLSSQPVTSLKVLSACFPKFITYLNLSSCNLQDAHVPLLRTFTNLKVLDLAENVDMTDRTMIHIANLASSTTAIGLPFLEEVYLTCLRLITDKSLKYIPKLPNLLLIELSQTGVIDEVACHFLTNKGFKQNDSCDKTTYYQIMKKRPNINPKLHEFIKKISVDFSVSIEQQRMTAVKNDTIPRKLCFVRDKNRHLPPIARVEQKPVLPRKKVNIKKRKLTINDFLSSFEAEAANDD